MPALPAAVSNHTEQALKIFFDARGERLRFFTKKFREAGINGDEIRRMVQRFVGGIGERKTIFVGRQMLVRRIRLDEQTIRWDMSKNFALAKFAPVQKVAGKTEIRAE